MVSAVSCGTEERLENSRMKFSIVFFVQAFMILLGGDLFDYYLFDYWRIFG